MDNRNVNRLVAGGVLAVGLGAGIYGAAEGISALNENNNAVAAEATAETLEYLRQPDKAQPWEAYANSQRAERDADAVFAGWLGLGGLATSVAGVVAAVNVKGNTVPTDAQPTPEPQSPPPTTETL